MSYPPEIIELIPIPDVIAHTCTYDANVEVLYKQLPDLLIPILIGKLKNHDYCFSQVIRLCTDDVNVDICSGYNDINIRCPIGQYRFILFLIDLVFIRNGSVAGRHSQALLVDTLFQTVEFFEPNGPTASWYPLISSFLEYKFSALLPTYKFLSTTQFCPYIGPQAISELGICGSFSLLFILLRVYNEDLTSGEIIGRLVNLSRKDLQSLMKQFICYVITYAKENNFQKLQNMYDHLSNLSVNAPELLEVIDKHYYNLDYNELVRFGVDYGLLEYV